MGARDLPRGIVAPWLSPSVLEPTLWMVSLRNARSPLKFHSACQRVPRGGGCNQGSPREFQEGPERVLGIPQKEHSSARPPQNGTKIEVYREPKSV